MKPQSIVRDLTSRYLAWAALRVVEDYLAGTLQEVPAGSGSGFVWDDIGRRLHPRHDPDRRRHQSR